MAKKEGMVMIPRSALEENLIYTICIRVKQDGSAVRGVVRRDARWQLKFR